MNWFIVAFGLGFVGSLHCAGMCGPIALALPFNQLSKNKRLIGNVSYQIGRITTYAAIGLLFGLIGRGFSIAGIQQPLSIALGALMIVTILLPRLIPLHKSPAFMQKTVLGLKRNLSKYLTQKGIKAYYITGILNGFLPCGLVYMALLGALGIGNPIESAGFMAAFGFGTFPMMFALAFTGNIISAKWRSAFNRAIPYFVVLLGLIFILRGLGLGIKYISPPDQALQVEQTEQCH